VETHLLRKPPGEDAYSCLNRELFGTVCIVPEAKFKRKENRSKSSRTTSAYSRGKYFSERLGVLAGRDFRRFYVGYTASLLGTAMSSVAIAFALLGAGGTATGLGIVFTANIVPMVAFILFGGALADRLGRRRVMLAADLVRCAAQAALATALAAGRPSLWLFVAAALAVGVGNAFFSPALSGLPVQLVSPGQLGDANALLGTAQPAAQVAGPALAGVLIAVTSPALVIAVDAGTYALSALALAMLRLRGSTRRQARWRDAGRRWPWQAVRRPGARGSAPLSGPGCRQSREAAQRQRFRDDSLLRDLAEGWAEFTARPWLWPQTVQFALFNLVTWGPYLVLGPILADQYLGGARAWGVVLACSGGGAVLGGLLALGRRPRRPLLVATVTTLGFALPPLALALRLPLPVVAGAALGQGLGSALGGAFASTVEQRLIPAAALSRVGAFNMVGAFALGPVAFVAAGPEAALFGPRAVLAFGAAWSVVMTLAVLAVPAVRRLPWPDSPGPVNEIADR
jgi:MFS family permease